ncbi:hypothetical protein [Lacrimispora sp. 210928-DFI.3.58]|uniref:hypothetical protein n=1 Tax=Lacrimispora sp. 210928-DFI.3.58 TaxID=2883214 RepID=UPI001D06F700|nr:hypothetical protein [Lacrimispora sp. 210928-DFI.3.58]MCB7321097.1 hypothetical protein [Lacrimispora sp. 210928-DFI.3.58]
MRKTMNLQLFADGGEGGSGAQDGNAGSGNGSQGNVGGTYSFEQAEEIANARAERAEKAALRSYFQQQGMTEEEVRTALADYKANKERQKPDVAAIEKERDEANRKIQQYENEKVLSGLKVRGEDLDYVMFKVSKLVTDKKDFKTAAAEWLKENPRYKEGGTYRMSSGVAAGDNKPSTETGHETINNMIRGAFGRK